MAIFNSYVSLPEGTSIVLFWGFWPMIDTPQGVSRTNLCLGGSAARGESGGKISIR
jgi:hypothetical protein